MERSGGGGDDPGSQLVSLVGDAMRLTLRAAEAVGLVVIALVMLPLIVLGIVVDILLGGE